jgi:hypothetical protein
MVDRNPLSGVGGRDQRRLFLSTALATRREKRVALAIAAIALVAFLVTVPFVRLPLAKMPAFIPSYEAALFFIDLITAVLLFDQFFRVRSGGILFLASGYLFDAFIIVPHALSFPGAFAPTGLLGAKEQTTAWLYVFWHGGFPLFVLCYALWGRGEASGGSYWTSLRLKWAMIGSIFAVAALTIILVLMATWGHDFLPVVMRGGDYSLLVKTGISPAVWALTLLAMVLLWRREQRVMDLWLMLVMWIWLFDIALSAVIGSTRFDLGFYAGRIFGLIAASFLLVTLIVESAQIYANALGAAASAEQRLAQLERARRPLEVRNVKTARDEPVELFVLRQNIARYRTMLESRTLDEGQRRMIERLLSEEEGKYRAMDSPKMKALRPQ